MQEVKRIFHGKYKICNVDQLQEYNRGRYKLGKIKEPIVYSVDCIFLEHPQSRGKRCDEFIEDFLNNDPATDNQPFEFTPFCVSKGIRPSVRTKLRQCKIHIGVHYRPIRQVNFNHTL